VEGLFSEVRLDGVLYRKNAEKVPKLAHLGYALSHFVGYKGKAQPGGFSRSDRRGVVVAMMAFLVVAVPGSSITVSAVFLLYVLWGVVGCEEPEGPRS
jgi:VanZ family protein